MSAATTRRTKGTAKRAVGRKKVRKISWFDRFLRALPLTQEDIQRILTWGIIAVLVLALLLIASWLRLPQMAYQQFGLMTAKAGFEVKNIETVGMQRVDQIKVYNIVLAEHNKPLLLVDIDRIQKDLTNYGWIKNVRVTRRLPDTLLVDISERKPTAIWQRGGKYSLLDDEGVVLDDISVSQIGNLPIINGEHANENVIALNALLENAQSLKGQVSGASWVGNRRWDLQFRTGETLALPEGEELAAQALINFTRMDGIHRLLGRDMIHIDMRDPARAYMRRAAKNKVEEKEVTKDKAEPKSKPKVEKPA